MFSKPVVIAIGGVKGVGKTTIIRKLKEVFEDFTLISSGKLLQKISKQKYSKDFLSLNKKEKERVRSIYAEYVYCKMNNNIILDLHYGEFEDGGYPCVVPNKILKIITHYILITDDKNAILNRRSLDKKSRRLDLVSIRLNILGEQLLFNQITSSLGNKKRVTVHNLNIDDSANKISNFIQKSYV